MTTYHEFDQKEVSAALDAAAKHYDHKALVSSGATVGPAMDDGHLALSAGCVSVTVENGKVCLNLPVVGKECLPIPAIFPNGTAAEACISICTTFSIPTGVRVTISVAGRVIVTKTFGKC